MADERDRKPETKFRKRPSHGESGENWYLKDDLSLNRKSLS